MTRASIVGSEAWPGFPTHSVIEGFPIEDVELLRVQFDIVHPRRYVAAHDVTRLRTLITSAVESVEDSFSVVNNPGVSILNANESPKIFSSHYLNGTADNGRFNHDVMDTLGRIPGSRSRTFAQLGEIRPFGATGNGQGTRT